MYYETSPYYKPPIKKRLTSTEKSASKKGSKNQQAVESANAENRAAAKEKEPQKNAMQIYQDEMIILGGKTIIQNIESTRKNHLKNKTVVQNIPNSALMKDGQYKLGQKSPPLPNLGANDAFTWIGAQSAKVLTDEVEEEQRQIEQR